MLKCDFCGKETDFVQRIAIDKDYDRLTVRHEKRYACAECSAKKDATRLKAAAQKAAKAAQ